MLPGYDRLHPAPRETEALPGSITSDRQRRALSRGIDDLAWPRDCSGDVAAEGVPLQASALWGERVEEIGRCGTGIVDENGCLVEVEHGDVTG